MVYEPTTNFKDSNGVDLGKKLVTQDYIATVYPNLNSAFSALIAYPAELYIWGDNNSGQIGDNTIANRSTPIQEFTRSCNWEKISGGGSVSGAIKTDGTLWMWGTNYPIPSIGDNTRVTRSTPRQISIAAAGGLTGWKQISCGLNANPYAIRDDGTLWSWGQNNYGSAGDNTIQSRSTPRQISAGAGIGINGWTQVSGGANFGLAIRYDGTLWSWGYNFFGGLGQNTSGNTARSTPRQEATSSTNWKQVSAGGYHVLAIKTDGTLWGWGWNANGQLGDNTSQSRSTPTQISAGAGIGINGWKQVSAGFDHSAAIRTDGTLWVWGGNTFSQLGINLSIGYRSTPLQEFTASNNWKQVCAGNNTTTAIKTDGTLWVWGSNTGGQLGDNTTQTRSTPRQEFTSSNSWRFIPDHYVSNNAAIKFTTN
jgi:alpha-tubulin suppressor-like RCC1 family protein